MATLFAAHTTQCAPALQQTGDTNYIFCSICLQGDRTHVMLVPLAYLAGKYRGTSLLNHALLTVPGKSARQCKQSLSASCASRIT